MASNYKMVDEKVAVNPAARTSFCQRNKSGSGSFVSSLRDHIHEFIHASTDEHRTCLRNTIQKIIDASKNFGKDSDNPSKAGKTTFVFRLMDSLVPSLMSFMPTPNLPAPKA